MKVTEEIKARVDIVEVIGETVKLRRTGSAYTGFCPFHDNKNTPAFVIWPDSGSWKCFGACNDGGDVFSFVMKKEGWDFRETLQFLARRAGVELSPPNPQQEQQRKERKRLLQLLTMVSKYYQRLLRENPAAQAAREHLKGRGISEKSQDEFGLGYALPAWEALRKHCATQGFTDDDLVSAGLLVKKEDGKTFDRFRHRIMLPICEQRGQVVGFGARIVSADDAPKFMNSPQTDLFDKGALLYGIERAYLPIREQGAAVLVEGYMDVIAAHQAGFANVVSAMGTALSEQQLRLLKRYAPSVVLALDPDVAGDRATLRSLSVARETLDRESVPAFNPRGLLRNEGHLQLDIRVVTLPAGMDPDELIAADPEHWRALTSDAQPIVDYVMDRFTVGRDLADSKTKAEIIDDIMPIIADVSHPAERADYQQKLARLLRVDERVIESGRGRSRSGSARPARAATPPASSPEATPDQLQNYLLAALLRQPDLLVRIDRSLRESGADALSSQDFSGPEFQGLFAQLQRSLHQAEMNPAEFMRNKIESGLLECWETLWQQGETLMVEDERRGQDVINAAVRLRRRNLGAWLQELQFLENAAREHGELEQAQVYQDLTMQHTRALGGLQRLLWQQKRSLQAVGSMRA
ncbi:MAG: DNA primase [Anaerolineales bacterium]|jgi:DNA primase|nr:DNA primase [Anaerolineales bacterium]